MIVDDQARGHWWLETDKALWPSLWDLAVGDLPVVTVYIEVEGELEPNVAELVTGPQGDPIRVPPRGAADKRLVVKHIRDIRPIPRAEFNELVGIGDD